MKFREYLSKILKNASVFSRSSITKQLNNVTLLLKILESIKTPHE